jgi:hypothetical protein
MEIACATLTGMPVNVRDSIDEMRARLDQVNQAIFALELLQAMRALSGSQLPWTTELLAVRATSRTKNG